MLDRANAAPCDAALAREDQSGSAGAAQESGRVSRTAHGLPDHFAGRYDRDRVRTGAGARAHRSTTPLDIPDNLIVRAAQAVLDAMKHRRAGPLPFDETDSDGRRTGRRIEQCGGGAAGASGAGRASDADRAADEIAASISAATCRFSCTAGRRWAGPGHRALSARRTSQPSRFWWFRRAFTSPPDRPMQALGRGLTFTGSSSSINSFQAFVRALGDGALARGGECAQRERFRGGRFPAVSPAQNDRGQAVESSEPRVSRMTGSGSAIFATFRVPQGRGSARERCWKGIGCSRAAG